MVLAIVVLAVLLLVFGFSFRDKLGNIFNRNQANLSGYQAVFLSNGQVYFGKLSETGDQYAVLKNIFYLQANNQLQAAANPDSSQSQLSLVKLGNELHGPDDQMNINRDQILFFENLKADSRVAKAIAEYQKNNGAVGAGNGATVNKLLY